MSSVGDQPLEEDESLFEGASGELQEFASSPQGYIIGVVLSTIISGVESMLLVVLDGITFIFEGGGPGTEGMLGLADIPLWLGEMVVDVGETIGGSPEQGTGILGVIAMINDAAIGLADSAGLLGPVIMSAYVAGLAIGSAIILRKLVMIAIDFIPGGGGLTQ